MKIRSLAELSDIVDADFAWRKKELTTAYFLVQHCRKNEVVYAIRAGICLLYAHWEGFVKNGATAYLCYVARQGLNLCELTASLVALSLRSTLRQAEATDRITVHTQVAEVLISDLQSKHPLPWESAVPTRDNLNSEVLREIICLLGLEYKHYATKDKFLDEKLLSHRNEIAHGERAEFNAKDYEDLHNGVLGLMELFRTDMENAAAAQRFRR